MFLVRGIDGIQRAFIPGELRSRRRVEQVIEAAPVVSTSSTETSSQSEPHTQREALISRYQHQETSQSPEEVRFAREIMTSPAFTIAATTSLGEVTGIFTEKRFRHIPVVSNKGKIIGLISDRDVLRHRATTRGGDLTLDQKPIEAVMVTEVLIATPDTRIREIAQVMFEERIGSMPIVDDDAVLIGIITRSDIVRAVVKHGPMRLWA